MKRVGFGKGQGFADETSQSLAQGIMPAFSPLKSPPPEIVEQGLGAILAYLRDQLESTGGE